MWYLVLYVVLGIVVLFATTWIIVYNYMELDYDIETAVDVLNEENKIAFGRYYKLKIWLGLMITIALWPIAVYLGCKRYIDRVNEYFERIEEQECLEIGEIE